MYVENLLTWRGQWLLSLLCARQGSGGWTRQEVSEFFLTSLWGGDDYSCPQFTEEETEEQRGKGLAQGHLAGKQRASPSVRGHLVIRCAPVSQSVRLLHGVGKARSLSACHPVRCCVGNRNVLSGFQNLGAVNSHSAAFASSVST